jgi:hypothetical protein
MRSELASALAKVQENLPKVGKNKTADVPGRPYTYAGLDDVSEVILPLLGKHGLSFTAWPTLNDGKLILAYALLHESGEERGGTYPLPTGTPQQIGSAITYARRYCLCAVTGIAADDDDDGAEGGNAQAPKAAAGRQRSQRPPAAPKAPVTRTQTTGPEHERLRHGTVEPTPDTRPAARTRGPVPDEDNPWQGMPPEEQPGSATAEQIKSISIVYSNMGFKATERDQVHAISERIIGRQLTGPNGEQSHKNLSFVEAAKLKDTLDSTDRVHLEDDMAAAVTS